MSSSGSVQECWYGVSDPRKRKQIQDRLAQRARRKRLASLRDGADDQLRYGLNDTPSDSSESIQQDCSSSSLITLGQKAQGVRQPTGPSISQNRPEAKQLSSQALDDLYMAIPIEAPAESSLPIDQRIFPRPQLSVFAAMWDNGAMMGISCCCGFTAKSKVLGPEIPLSLHPTPLQLSRIHLTWIDRFPFPRMRDNMISLSGLFDEEVFLEDLFKEYSFTLVPGGLSYDPSAWRIGKEFALKWGYLFY
jgi:hypothetical protein